MAGDIDPRKHWKQLTGQANCPRCTGRDGPQEALCDPCRRQLAEAVLDKWEDRVEEERE